MKGGLGQEAPGEQQSGDMKCCRSPGLHVRFLVLDLPLTGRMPACGGGSGCGGATGARLVAGRLQPSWDTTCAQVCSRPPERFGRSAGLGVVVSKERQMVPRREAFSLALQCDSVIYI